MEEEKLRYVVRPESQHPFRHDRQFLFSIPARYTADLKNSTRNRSADSFVYTSLFFVC